MFEDGALKSNFLRINELNIYELFVEENRRRRKYYSSLHKTITKSTISKNTLLPTMNTNYISNDLVVLSRKLI